MLFKSPVEAAHSFSTNFVLFSIVVTLSDRATQRTDLILHAANNTTIHTYGNRSLTLDLGLEDTFAGFLLLLHKICSIILDVKTPILGHHAYNPWSSTIQCCLPRD